MKSVKVIIMTLAALLFIGTAAAQTLDDAVAKYTAAMEKAQNKDLVGAIPLLEEALNMGIDLGEDGVEMVTTIQGILPKMYMQKGMMEAQGKKFEDAVASLLKAEELADTYGDVTVRAGASRTISSVYMAMGVDSFNNKEYEKALEVFSKGYEQDPSNVKLANYTAKSYAELGDFAKASQIYKGVIETGTSNSKYAEDAKSATTDVTTYALVGISAASEAKDLEKAIEFADTLETAVPNEPVSLLAVIQLANNMKKYSVVIERGEKAAEAQTEPEKKSEAYFLLGVAYQNSGNNAKAIESFRKVTAGPNAAAARTAAADLSKL